jgi:hypothetical protein
MVRIREFAVPAIVTIQSTLLLRYQLEAVFSDRDAGLRAFERLAEHRILEAIERGELDNLPGAGEPLLADRDPMVPDAMWLSFKTLKYAGCVLPEVEEQNEIRRLEELLADLEDEAERVRAQTRLSLLPTRIEINRSGGAAGLTKPRYQDGLAARLSRSRRG